MPSARSRTAGSRDDAVIGGLDIAQFASFSSLRSQELPQLLKTQPGKTFFQTSPGLDHTLLKIVLEPSNPEDQGGVESHNIKLRLGSTPLKNSSENCLILNKISIFLKGLP